MYALLISVPIINCVNDQSKGVCISVTLAEKSAHDDEKYSAWIYDPNPTRSGTVKKAHLYKLQFLPLTHSFTDVFTHSFIHFIFNSLFHSVNQLTAFLVGGPAGLMGT